LVRPQKKPGNAIIPSLRSRAEVLCLADELGIAPGILVGRYQFLTEKWNFFKDLIRPLRWAEDK